LKSQVAIAQNVDVLLSMTKKRKYVDVLIVTGKKSRTSVKEVKDETV